MHAKWLLALAFLSLAAFVAGCSDKSDRGYAEYDDYEAEIGGGGAPPPPAPGGGVASSHDPVGDVTGGGLYGRRIYAGSGAESRGGVISEADYKEFSSVGKDVVEAHKLYQDYFSKKATDGTQDMATLSRAMSMLEQLLPRADALLDKYPDNHEVQSYLSTITEDLRALGYEK